MARCRATRLLGARAFTILEIVTVVVIIAILLILLLPAFDGLIARMEKVRCMANLRNLHVSANSYLQANSHWPQIDTELMSKEPAEFAKEWIAAFQPFGLEQKSWICPTMQKLLSSPDLTQPNNVRLDYIPMTFDEKQMTPLRWSRQPWFIERGAVHGNGNLVIFTDGSISEANDIILGLH